MKAELKLGQTADIDNAAYMRELRKQWAEIGFTQFSALVHKDDRKKIAATLNIIRFERLLKMIETSDETLYLASTRNMPKLPSMVKQSHLNERIDNFAVEHFEDNAAARKAGQFRARLDKAQTYAKKATALHSAYRVDPDSDETIAKAVIFGNLCVQTIKLLEAELDEEEHDQPKE